MATVTGFTADRMQEIEDAAIVDGNVVGGDLILVRHDGLTINAGTVVGDTGATGAPGPAGPTSVAVVTSGTRPTGGARFTGLFIYETDTKFVFVWDGAAWLYRGGVIICTSGARPGAPFTGLKIYESDTKRSLVYDGTNWVFDSPHVIARQTDSALRSGIGSAGYTVPNLPITYTFINGRIYRFSVKLMVDITAGNGLVVSIYNGATELTRLYQNNGLTGANSLIISAADTLNALNGATTLNLVVSSPFGTANITGTVQPSRFMCEDLGII